ncbi:hypothetical protein LR68_01799 [Anoxybacillus sp. BCO1]|nr:hypothetical protein LR68_01799 [Anoxybacillus sp. BCO1]
MTMHESVKKHMSIIIQKDIETMVQHIVCELIKEFEKNETEVKELIQKSDVVKS